MVNGISCYFGIYHKTGRGFSTRALRHTFYVGSGDTRTHLIDNHWLGTSGFFFQLSEIEIKSLQT